MDRNYYEDILNNFDAFCDQFETAAAKRFSGLDNDSRQPIDNAEVKRSTPRAAQEVNDGGEEGIRLREPPIDVQAAPLPELPDYSGDSGSSS